MAHTEEPHLKLETVCCAFREVGRADHRWSNEGSNERLLVRVTLFRAKQLWA